MLPFLMAVWLGCAGRVQVALPPAPAVQLAPQPIAVVAADRACRPYAAALLDRLSVEGGLRVDPRSDLRVLVFSCGQVKAWTVERDVSDAGDESRGRVEGRAYAVAAVSNRGETLAHLLGTSRSALADATRLDAPAMGRSMDRRLVDAVATDLALQMRPGAWSVTRRVFRNPPDGSARDLHTRAVAAEAAGDLVTAHQLALAASRARPSARARWYVSSLERQIGVQLAAGFPDQPSSASADPRTP